MSTRKSWFRSFGQVGGLATVATGIAEVCLPALGDLLGSETGQGAGEAVEGIVGVVKGDADGAGKIISGLFKVAIGFGLFGVRRRQDR